MAAGLVAVAGVAGAGAWRVLSPPPQRLMLVQETVTYRHGAGGRLIETRETNRKLLSEAAVESSGRGSRLKTFSTP